MEPDDITNTDNPLTQLLREDLDPLSVDELEDRITLLKGEIERVKGKLTAKSSGLAAAEALFSKS